MKVLIEEIKVNMIFIGQHGWMANAIESGSNYNINHKFRVSAVTNKFICMVDKRGNEYTYDIKTKKQQEGFLREFDFLRQMQLDDFYYNKRAGLYSICDGIISRQGMSFIKTHGYTVKFTYKDYGFILTWISDSSNQDRLPKYLKPIKKEMQGGKYNGTWYFGCNQTFKDKLDPESYSTEIAAKAQKFMFFLHSHFSPEWINKIKFRQSQAPLLLLK